MPGAAFVAERLAEKYRTVRSGHAGRTARSGHAGRSRLWVPIGLGVLWIALATAAQVFRQPGVPAYDTLWAEDGHVFLADALTRGTRRVLFQPLAGYMHLLPRTIAWVAAALPPEAAAQVFSVGSALVVALLSLYVFVAARPILPAVWARAVLAVLFVVLPATAYESANTAANLHFYLPFPTFLALLERPSRLRQALPGLAVVLAATLSDPRVGLLLPLALYAVWRGRGWAERAIAWGFLGGLTVQLAVVAASRFMTQDPTLTHYPVRVSTQFGPSNLFDLPRLFGLRVVGPILVGERAMDDLFRSFGWLTSLVALAVVGVVTVVGVRRADRGDRVWILGALGLSLLFFCSHALAWGTKEFWPYQAFFPAANRYVFTPILFLVLSIVVVLGGRDGAAARSARPFRYAFVALLAMLVAVNFSPRVARSEGPSWSANLRAAKTECRANPNGSARVVIAPAFAIADPWFVPVACRRLLP